MRRPSRPSGPSIISSRTPAIPAGGAISAMRVSYCVRATSTGNVCVAGRPVPLSSSAWTCGSTGMEPPLLGCAHHRSRAGRQKTVEHLSRTFAEPGVVLSIKHPDAVDEHALHADWVAQGAGAATGQIIDPAPRRDADRGRVEQQYVGPGTDS